MSGDPGSAGRFGSNGSGFRNGDDLHLAYRFAAAQLISVGKHSRGAVTSSIRAGKCGYNRDSSNPSDIRRTSSTPSFVVWQAAVAEKVGLGPHRHYYKVRESTVGTNVFRG